MSFLDFSNSSSINAPELPDNLTWLNSRPLYLDRLRGQVILVDFWTYSCINCQRTLPYLKKWWDKYKDKGLVIIGVHTPEFEFEKDVENVKKALKKYQVTWPTVLDNDYKIWESFANHYWPAKYLINSQGKIIYTHFGEGNYQETELEIQKALSDAGFKVSDATVGVLEEGITQREQTPELYCGSKRGTVINVQQNFLNFSPDQIYTIGQWDQEEEFLQHSRSTEDLDDLVILKFNAKTVYLVMESEENEEIKVYVTLDGVGLKGNSPGKDIEFDQENRSFVRVKMATLYNLVDLDRFGEHTLRISSVSKSLRLYAFTFGS